MFSSSNQFFNGIWNSKWYSMLKMSSYVDEFTWLKLLEHHYKTKELQRIVGNVPFIGELKIYKDKSQIFWATTGWKFRTRLLDSCINFTTLGHCMLLKFTTAVLKWWVVSGMSCSIPKIPYELRRLRTQ